MFFLYFFLVLTEKRVEHVSILLAPRESFRSASFAFMWWTIPWKITGLRKIWDSIWRKFRNLTKKKNVILDVNLFGELFFLFWISVTNYYTDLEQNCQFGALILERLVVDEGSRLTLVRNGANSDLYHQETEWISGKETCFMQNKIPRFRCWKWIFN